MEVKAKARGMVSTKPGTLRGTAGEKKENAN